MSPRDVELIYELSPMQQAMLFASLYAPRSGVYVVQLGLRLSGPLDLDAFERAWRLLVERHTVLRTGFYWEDLEKPVQVVYGQADLELQRESWSDAGVEEQEQRLRDWMDADRERGFDLDDAPLMRLALFEVGENDRYFVWTVHHLVVDGWSMGLLLRELFAGYKAFAEGREPSLPAVRPYGDYIAWLQRQDAAEVEAFWRRSLGGLSSPTLMADGDGREAAGFRQSDRRSVRLEAAAAAALRATAQRHRLTLNTLMQGAWAVLLAQATGRDEVVFGATVAGRPGDLPGADAMVGLFINTLPVRVEVDWSRPLLPWLAELQERQAEARDFEHAPLYEVQTWSGLPAGSALFDTLLVFENHPVDGVAAGLPPGLSLARVLSNELTNYPLNLVVIPGAEPLLELMFDSRRIDAPAALRLLDRLTGVVGALAVTPDRRLRDLPLLSAAERHQIVTEWNDTAADLSGAALCLHELFAAQAERTPDAVAVEMGDRRWSYREVLDRTRRLARRLRRLGVGPETLVGIHAERSLEMVVGALAALEAGGAWLPLDPSYPAERLELMVADSGTALVLVQEELLPGPALPDGVRRLALDDPDGDAAPLEPRTGPDNLAYVIYTSGSTGRPKGVAVRHRGVVNRLLWGQEVYGLGPDDAVLQKAPFSFDISVWELFAPLIAGARLVLAAPGGHRDPAYLVRALADHRVTFVDFVPSLLGVLLEEPELERCRWLRQVFTGGEALPPAVRDRFLERLGPRGVRLDNQYGPTEVSIDTACWVCRPGPVTIGRPIANSRLHVLDRELRSQPIGVAGELAVGGTGLARGYFGRPDLTADRFVPDPFAQTPGGRLYRTGDLVRTRADGELEFLGRVDTQVKIRGFRIEPGEIERALSSHPDVRECVVLAREDAPGKLRLVAYVIGREGRVPEVDALRASLRGRLPEYMVPAAFVTLKALPLTANGKVDRRALPAPEIGAADEGVSGAPTDPLEELLAGVWAEVLGLDRVGVNDDFFALGGHSLLATQVVSRLRGALEMELPLRALFEAPTVAALARVVRAARQDGRPAAPPILPMPREGNPPLSFAQQRLWFLDQLEPGSPLYNIPSAVRLTGEVSHEVLTRIFAEVLRRHEVLRTTFGSSDGQPAQLVSPDAKFDLPLVDLSSLPEREREGRVHELARIEAREPFDLERGPLLRVTLLRLAGREHVLLLTMHHIVSDGWSMGLLLREVAALHEAFSQGRPSPLPELPVQYADFALWQRSWMLGEVLAAQLDYWKRQLDGAPPLLELPTDRPRPVVQTWRGASRPVSLPAALSEDLLRLCRQEGVTPFMALLAAWAVLMGRHAGQEDVVVGTPVAGRNRREIEDLIGLFVNTLVLRTDLSEEPQFIEVLRRVRRTSLDAFTHQDLPFERIVEELVPERNLAVSPVFQVVFALQNAPGHSLSVPGLTLSPIAAESAAAKFDLTLMLWEGAEGFGGTLEHNTDLFDGATAERLLGGFTRLLAGALEDPERPVGSLALLSETERHQTLVEWSGAADMAFPQGCLHELLAESAASFPERVALSFEGEHLTYGELNRRANRLAHHLLGLGVGVETLVGLCSERSVEMVVGILGILKAGGACLPLDPSHPASRLALLLDEVDVRFVVAQERFAEMLPLDGRRLVALAPGADLPGGRDGNPPVLTVPDNLAYVLFTSGSTGRPKGVGVPHRAGVRLVRGREDLAFGGDEVWIELAPLAFDASVLEVWAPLANGGRLAVFGPEKPTLEEIGRAVKSCGVTSIWLTTGLFNQMVEEDLGALRTLRKLMTGGDVMSPDHARRALEELPGCRLLNGYGPTENGTFTTTHTFNRPDEVVPGAVPIGRPIAATRVVLLDRNHEPVPMGVAGELCTGGAGLARGYLKRPDLTAERFIPDPVSEKPGERLYRTGDLARCLPDGHFVFLGRMDKQVKIRGFRIEPGEVERVLAEHPGVEACVVLARRDGPGGSARLVAYVVGRDGEAPRGADLRRYLQDRLPEFMIPAAFVALETLPLTPNGKVDRGALPAPERDGYADETDYAAPTDPVEEILAGLWAELLGHGRVGIHDDFFALGGHSLLATRVMSRVRESFGVELPLRALFQAPTVAGLAAIVRQSREEAAPPPILPVPRTGDLPLSFAQQRLWFLDQLEPANPAYNIPWAVRLDGDLDPCRLARVFAEVSRRHETLRTTFKTHGDQPTQVIHEAVLVALPLIDLGGLPDEAREARARQIAVEEARRTFDLEHGPLLRLTLVRLGERDHLLLVAIHHIISDGWSMGVLLREIAALHAAFSQGLPSPLPELPVQYADFATWQRGWLQGEPLEKQLSFWRTRLAGAPQLLELPTDRPRPSVQTWRGVAQALSLPPALSESLRELCRREGITPFMALIAAWSVLLGHLAGQDDVLVGSPIANRNRREIEDLIGFFVNTIVLRTEMADSPGFSSLVARVRSAALDAYAHQDLPFERVVEELVPERSLSHSPLFQVLFAFQNAPGAAVAIPGLELRPVTLDSGVAQFDLSLSLWEGAHGFAGVLEHNTDLFDSSTAARLLTRFQALLDAVAGSPDLPTADLPVLLPEERLQLLEWSGTSAPCGSDLCLHELFAAQAARTPTAVALVHGGGRLTYEDLAARAGGLARCLRGLGVGPETRVAVCLERSPDLIASLLGVIGAGGAYVPIDPAYPVERRALMLEDSGAAVLVTRGRLAADLPNLPGCRVLDLDVEPMPDAGLPGGSGVGPDHLAYVVYTSGSTGRPKGVAVEHRSAVALAGWAREALSDEELSGVLASTSVCFDVSVFEIFVPLALGGTIILAENALALPTLPDAPAVRLVSTVPSAATELVRAGGLPASVRTVALAGEPLPGALAARLHETGTVRRVLNVYGPSEDTVYSTAAEVPSAGDRPPAIGRPIPGTQAYVVNRRGASVPPGVAGELQLAGAGLARGYLGRPELTAERFVPNPFGDPGARLYRTGDLVRFRPDGELEFLGRIDHQVKIRGFRIELGEIETALGSHPGIRECVVLAREDIPGSRLLVAYLTGDVPAAGELRAFLAARLPDYMIPSFFVPLAALPLTPNGKLDRKALPAPPRTGAMGEDVPADPSADPIEGLLAAIWAEALGLDHVGARDDVFSLGAHSLLATRVVSRIRGAFRVELPLRRVFETPTVSGLAQTVRQALQESRPQAPPLVRTMLDHDLPLSFAQQRLWLLDQIAPGSATYNVPLAARLTGALSVGLLARVFAEIVRRHEVLRTTFAARQHGPVQIVAPELRPALPVVDLSGLPEPAREALALRLGLDAARRPFDLERGPLLRLALLRLAEDEHVLVGTVHHIVFDGWSMGLLLREISLLYEAFSEGRPSPLPDLPLQYADFAAWQRGWLQGEALEEQLAYWRRQLDGAPRLLELPTDRLRPPVQSPRGSSVPVSFPAHLSAALRALCRQDGVTPFMVLLASWALLLGRHAGQSEVLVGTPVAGRVRQELEELIGFFVNTLVLRTDLSGGPAFAELLGRVRRAALDAYSHQDLPVARLIEELVPERDLARAPLFQVMFTLQNTPRERFELGELTLGSLLLETGTAKFDLNLAVSEEEGGLRGGLEYSSDLFDRSTVLRLLGHWRTLLEALTAEPGRSVAELPLLTAPERLQLLTEWNDEAVVWPLERPLHELIRAWAEQDPEAPAVAGGESVLSRGELARRSARLARTLRALGVGPETPVGVCAGRSAELIVGILGVLEAGGVYVPLDPNYPRQRLALLIEDARPAALLVERGREGNLPATDVPRLFLDEVPASPETAPGRDVGPEGLAYIIYTSGSTGRPKGVACTHRGALNLLLDLDRKQPLRPGEACSLWTSVSFDVSVWEIFSALCFGGVLHLPSEEERVSAERFFPWLQARGIRSAYLPPFLLAEYAAWLEREPGRATLRRLLVGVEPIPEPLLRRILAASPGLRIVNGYGPTEATVCSTFYPVPAEPALDRRTPIGRAVANARVHLLDAAMQPVPIGVAGEVCIGGAGLARGYLDRPSATAEAFVPDPFPSLPGERLYRTGDLARCLPDGNLEFLGRRDHQVKIRGFRVEPGEIETILAAHPEVRACSVLAREDEPGEIRLVAYVVGEGGAGLVESLRSWLRERLPEHMQPAAWVRMEALPQTPNGKLDRAALPAPERTQAPDSEGFDGPVEELLASLWAEVLGLDRVGPRDDFFALGGHSLLATQVASRVREVFGVELPIRRFFESPVLADLARAVRSAHAEGGPQAPPLVSMPREGDIPLSFAQQRLWFLDRLEPGNPAYNIPLAVRLRGELSVDLLSRIFAEVIRRHETLRTTFASRGEQPVQVIGEGLQPELLIADLSDLPEGEREAEARHRLREEALRPFDLETGPLLRLSLLRLGEADQLLLMVMHHTVSDAWSMGILLREIAALHGAIPQGLPSPLPELPVQYADFARWQRGWLAGETLEAQLAYWRERLRGVPPFLDLPTDRPRAAAGPSSASRQRVFGSALTRDLRALGRRLGATPFMLLLATFDALLCRWSNQTDLIVGSPIAGRNRLETEGLIGLFVNTLAVRATVEPESPFRELLEQVRGALVEDHAHQDLPFEKLVEELQPERSLHHTPLFQVMFNLLNTPRALLDLPGVRLEPLPSDIAVPAMPSKFDLTLAVDDRGESLALSASYRSDLFDAGTIERMLSQFERILAGVTADPALRVSELPLLGPAEVHQLLSEWSSTRRSPLPDLLVHEIFEARAGQSPDALALVFEEERLPYAELNRRANRLAHRLRGLGVGPEARVGICTERSAEMIVALLAVLKAGGAYVPLDPTYPAARLAFMLEQSGAHALLVQEHLADLLPAAGRPVVVLGPAAFAEGRDENPTRLAGPGNLAYVLFTSGSTGQPKGVAVEHRQLVHYTTAVLKRLALGDAPASFATVSTLSADLGNTSVFPALLTGGTLHVLSAERAADPIGVEDYFLRERVDCLKIVPSHFKALRAFPRPAGVLPRRRLVFGGEALAWSEVDEIRALAPDLTLFNHYGPTESTVGVLTHRIVAGAPRLGSTVPLGRPLANVRVYVVDRVGRLAPSGVPGELLLGGAGLARGYLDRPDLTAARFVPDPFGREAGERLYRTGDLVRHLLDGTIEFLGRIDQQVKIRGFRVEPGEVEAALAGLAEVQGAAVVTREEVAGEHRLIAFLVAADGASPTPESLRSALQGILPDALIPSRFVLLPALPLTPNGKVDRQALARSAAEVSTAVERPYTPPGSAVEETLAEIWADLLRCERVGVHDNFFDLGGHSLLATRLISRVRESFGIDVPLRSLFEAPTIARLAEVVLAGQLENQDEDELEKLLAELEDMVDEQVEGSFPG